MDCQACQPMLAEYALGQLAEDERASLAQHLAGCQACQTALRETEEAWVALADALPPAGIPPSIALELGRRIAAERQRPATAGAAQPTCPAFTPEHDEIARPSRPPLSRRHLAIAAALFLAATIAVLSWLTYRQHQAEHQRAEADRQTREMERLRAELSKANELFDTGRLHFASLREAGAQAAVRGYIVWDRLSRQVHFYTFDLPPVAEDHVWQIWLVAEGKPPHAAGRLTPGPSGTGSAVVDAPPEFGDRFGLAIVEGPSGAASQPAREPWLTANVE